MSQVIVQRGGGPGIVSLEGQIGATQTFTDDTNVAIVSGSNVHVITWVGTLAKARQHANTVYNDQANTWSTGAQDMGSATSFKIPTSAGAAPTTAGFLAFDSTKNTLVRGQSGITLAGIGVLNVQASGDTNNSSSGSGADYDHTLTTSIGAGVLNSVGKLVRVHQIWYLTTGTPGSLQWKLKIGSTTIFNNELASSPGSSLTNRTFRISYDVITTTAGASGAVVCAPQGSYHAASLNASSTNGIAQPVGTFDLTGALTLTHTSRWGSAGTGTNTIQLLAAYLEVLN